MAKIVSLFKICSKCKIEKDISQFGRVNRRGRVEVLSKCIQCGKIYGKEWASKNKDKIQIKNRKHYTNNREKEIERSKKYYKNRPEYANSQSKKFRENNPEKIKFWNKRYHQNNREKSIISFHIRKARIKGVGGKIGEKEWRNLKEKYGNKCINPDCKNPYAKPLTLDHVIPVSLGGRNVIENAQPLCKSCNSRKNTKTIDYRKYYD